VEHCLAHYQEGVEVHNLQDEEDDVHPYGAGGFGSLQGVSLPYLPEADLRPKKAFKEATLKTDAAGACGLALIRCGELAFAALGKESPMIQRMKDACTGESLLSVLREVNEVKKEISKISNVGSGIAAGVFNQGIEDLRHLVCDSTTAKPIRSTLECCKPSLSHLFGDDEARIEKALEAVKFRPHQAAPYRHKAPSYFRSSDSQEGRDRKKKPYKRPYKSTQKPRSSGKANGPAAKEEGQKKKFLLRETEEVVTGLVFPAKTPRPATFPFQSAPDPGPSGGRGQTAPLPSFLEGGVGYPPTSSPSRGRLLSTLHISSTACLPRSWLLDSIAGSKQPLYRCRGGSSS
jgi:hypothetical protein